MHKKTRVGLIACFLVAGLVGEVAAGGNSKKIPEAVFNSGGGEVPESPSFRITLDALGDSVAGTAMSSESYRLAGGLPSAFPPPGLVENLHFASTSTDELSWDPEPSAGHYAVYRGDLGDLVQPGGPEPYGSCVAASPGTSATDGTLPPGGQGFFYLVTVANRLDEEGSKDVAELRARSSGPSPVAIAASATLAPAPAVATTE